MSTISGNLEDNDFLSFVESVSSSNLETFHSKAIHAIDEDSELKEKLVKKLYSLYDFERVIYAITKKEEAEHIYNLMQAIKHQKQVVL